MRHKPPLLGLHRAELMTLAANGSKSEGGMMLPGRIGDSGSWDPSWKDHGLPQKVVRVIGGDAIGSREGRPES